VCVGGHAAYFGRRWTRVGLPPSDRFTDDDTGTTTIRLPPKLRARIHALAKQSGRSAHSVILEAVERHADYEEQMRSLVKEAIEADDEIERTGEVYRADDVHAWVERLAQGTGTGTAQRPKPWRR
jgi:predicted transcriptional regulator